MLETSEMSLLIIAVEGCNKNRTSISQFGKGATITRLKEGEHLKGGRGASDLFRWGALASEY